MQMYSTEAKVPVGHPLPPPSGSPVSQSTPPSPSPSQPVSAYRSYESLSAYGSYESLVQAQGSPPPSHANRSRSTTAPLFEVSCTTIRPTSVPVAGLIHETR